ncbi:MAG TPA: hypothetical protein VFP24_00310 [Gaiellaceae bacterium]|nr:hypothetical protein [Gaiellaceae bacterium]
MAEAVVPDRADEPARPSEDLPRFEQRRAIHGGRFMMGYLVIVVLFGLAMATLAFMTQTDNSPSAPSNWAAWSPQDQGFQSAREIAQEISTRYKGGSGEQLAAITASPGEVQGIPIRYVAIRAGQRARLQQGDVQVLDPGETVLYTFCGLGGKRNCALPGTPSIQRSLLLRREALELSLFTFKHMGDVNTVISLLPPPTQDTGLAVVLQRKHVEQALDKPLMATLPSQPPYFMDDITTGEAGEINKYTGLHFFRSGFEVAPDQSVVLNLEVPQ